MLWSTGFIGTKYVINNAEPLTYLSIRMAFVVVVMAIIAAVVNGLCLWLLKRLREPDVNMRAATTFSLNDFVSNGGIILAGVIVVWTGQNWPDLIVGIAVAAIAVKGGLEILRDARSDAGTKGANQ